MNTITLIVKELAYGIAIVLGIIVLTMAVINLLGYILAGNTPTYNSSQGAAAYFWAFGVCSVPESAFLGFGMAIWSAWMRRKLRLQKAEAQSLRAVNDGRRPSQG